MVSVSFSSFLRSVCPDVLRIVGRFVWSVCLLWTLGCSSFAQSGKESDPMWYKANVKAYDPKQALLTLEVTLHTTEKKAQVFAFSTLENSTGFNSQIDVDTALFLIQSITSVAPTLQRITLPALSEEPLEVYPNETATFEVALQLRPQASLPKRVQIQWISIYLNEKKEIKTFTTASSIPTNDLPQATAVSDKTTIETLSLWQIFILSFFFGFLALLTPCIYAMMPLTVSFFIKKSHSRKEAIRHSLWYALSIIFIFAALGLLLTILLGPGALNWIATNSYANLFFFLVFIVFAVSFFGVFDINLPASWSTSMGKMSSRTNIIGIFFMALTLVIVSFSCTGPIIGNLLVLASRGSWLAPLVGNLGFSISLAIPFFLLSIFPSYLQKLMKSGAWFNNVKIILGFLELALALKFLSNADLSLGTRLLDREIFLALWIVLFFLMGLYFIGGIRFKHDAPLPKNEYGTSYVNLPRLTGIIACWAFVVYLVPGLWGAPLNGVAAFLPPPGTQEFRINYSSHQTASNASSSPSVARKYAQELERFEPEVVKSIGLVTYFDYPQALEEARKQHKPLMLDFTGINCINCRKMEAEVWSVPSVAKLLKEEFVIASLYVDANNSPLEKEDISVTASGRELTTIGEKYAQFQIETFDANVQPYYFFLDEQEQRILKDGYGYDSSPERFEAHLKNVLRIFHDK